MTTKAKATKAIVSLAATKAATKAPSNEVITLSNAEALRLADIVGISAYSKEDSGFRLADACKALHKAGVKLGRITATKTAKACPIIAAYVAGRFPGGFNRKNEAVDTATKAKYASYFKVAVESGKAYSEGNASKSAGKNIMIGFAMAASGEDAANKLLKGFNKMKDANSELATLAGFLIDALEEAGFALDDGE